MTLYLDCEEMFVTRLRSVGVVGAGATGAYLAGRLALAGIPVTLVARGDSVQAIRANGIRLTDPDGAHRVARPERIVTVHEIDTPVDYALFCVKTYDTDSATEVLAPLIGDSGHAVCLQNGVNGEQALASAFGASRVLSGVLYIGSERVSPGVISCSSRPRIIVGPYLGSDMGPSDELCSLFVRSGIDCVAEPHVVAAKWQKFLFNCGLNPLTAITGLRMGELLAEHATAEVFDMLVDEAHAVAVAAEAPLPAEARAQVSATARRMDISSSMAEDLGAGRPIELDAFTGYVIRLGEDTGIATPATRVVHGILASLDRGRRASRKG